MAGYWQGRKGGAWRKVVAQMHKLYPNGPCHICGHAIDSTLDPNDAMSYTVDHIVPRSVGGAPTIDNCLPAHRRCNSRRSNDMSYTQSLKTSRAW